jgi:hypothetical protein
MIGDLGLEQKWFLDYSFKNLDDFCLAGSEIAFRK